MNWRVPVIWMFAFLLLTVVACSRRGTGSRVIVEIPAGFSGNFVLEMGVKDAVPLAKQGDTYVVDVPHSGKVITSTFLDKPEVVFKNASDGKVWGYSQDVFTTGDGISIGGKIEFFVGTQKDFEAEQEKKKNKSGGALTVEPVFSPA